MGTAIHWKHCYFKHITALNPFTFNVVLNPLEGRPTDDCEFLIELVMGTYVPGTPTQTLFDTWKLTAHLRTGTLTVNEATKRGPAAGSNPTFAVEGDPNYAPDGRVVFAKVNNTTMSITVDPTVAASLFLGFAPNDFLDFQLWLDIRCAFS
jgi:hypothetical protein